MFQRKPRRFRRRSNGRNHHHGRVNDHLQTRPRSNSFSNGHVRNNFRTPQSAEKLFEKYNSLAKEAITSGDKSLSENYLQHADHFMRIIEDKKSKDQNNNNTEVREKLVADDKANFEKSEVKQEEIIKNKD